MKRTALLCFALAACQPSQPPERYGFIARLGREPTVSEGLRDDEGRVTIPED